MNVLGLQRGRESSRKAERIYEKKKRNKDRKREKKGKNKKTTLGWFIIPDRLFDEFKWNVSHHGCVAIGIETNAGERHRFILRHILTEA